MRFPWPRFRLSGPVSPSFMTHFHGDNYAEQNVTPDTVLNLSTVWACQRLIAGTVSTLPLHIIQRKDGKRRLAKEHPVSEILRGQPNANQTPMEFKEGTVASLIGRGMGYAKKETLAGDLSGLLPWSYDRCTPERTERGSLFYRLVNRNGTQDEVAPEKMFVLKGFTDNSEPDLGMSTLAYGRQTFGNASAVERTVGRQFGKGLKQAGYFQLTNPGARLDAETREQLRKVLNEYAGSDNAASVMLMEAGLEWKPMVMSAADAELMSSRAFNVEEICRWYQVPPLMIGHTDKMTSWPGGQEGMRKDFRDFCLLPHITRIEEAVNVRLLTRADRVDGYYCKISSEGLLRGNTEARTGLYSSALQNGWLTRNEVRELEEWDEMDGDGGDVFTVQQNLTPLDMLQEEAEARTMKNTGTPPAPTEPTPGV